VARFEARHPIGIKAHLALVLLLYAGVRRSDLVRLGRQHVIDASPTDDLTFLVTAQGKPFTAPGFTNWFRERCAEAALLDRSAHGLRKARAARAAENGATTHQLMLHLRMADDQAA
jgi:integrase